MQFRPTCNSGVRHRLPIGGWTRDLPADQIAQGNLLAVAVAVINNISASRSLPKVLAPLLTEVPAEQPNQGTLWPG
jgi:hypothetical protein